MEKLKVSSKSIHSAVHYAGITGAKHQIEDAIIKWVELSTHIKNEGSVSVYEYKKRNVLIYVDLKDNEVISIEPTQSNQQTKPLFYGQYKLNEHSKLRAKQRFGLDANEAENKFNQILKTAIFVSCRGTRRVYESRKGERIVIDVVDLEIKTVYKAKREKLSVGTIVGAVKKEFKKLSTQYQRDIRKLTEQHAEIALSVAQLTLNKVKCDAPHTKALLEDRISELNAKLTLISKEIDAKHNELARAEKQVREVIGE